MVVLVALAGQARGGSLVDCSLKGISNVRIVVVTAGLRYDAVPGLDLERVESGVKRAAEENLREHEISPANESGQTLLINFNKVKTADGSYLIMTHVRLRERARINRLAKAMPGNSQVVTSWESWQWEQSNESDAIGAILRSTQVICHDFAEAVSRAKQDQDCPSQHVKP